MPTYGPIVVDDTSGTFKITSLNVPAAAAAAIVAGLTPPPVVVTPPPPPVTGAVAFAEIPHTINDWSAAGEVTFGAHKYYTESANQSWSAQLSTNTSAPIYRGEVRNGQYWTGADGGNDTERAELDGSPTIYPKGTVFWYSYSFMVESGLPQIAGVVQPSSPGNPGGPLAWGIVGQIHGNGSEAAVPWSLSIVSEKIAIQTQQGAQVVTSYPVSALVRGQVYNVVVQIKITGDTGSTMTCWVNGKQVANSTGIIIGGSDAGNYVKFGIYRGWQGDGYSPLAVQVANAEHGTASLMARVAAPLPWPAVTGS